MEERIIKRRLNKEIMLDCCDNIEVKYGTTNKDNPRVIYISGKMWIHPKWKGDYTEVFNNVRHNFKNSVKRILSNNSVFDTRNIVDFDINPESLFTDRRSYLNVKLFVRQKEVKITKLRNFKTVVLHNFKYLFRDLENELIENDFEVFKTKE